MKSARKLQRKKAHRTWLLRNLVTSVILYEHVTTTEARAKEARRWIDRAIGWGKSATLANRRRLRAWLADPRAAKKVHEVLRERYATRPSGYSRLIRVGTRVGDGAPSLRIELVDSPLPATAAAALATEATETVVTPARRRLPSLRKPKAQVTVRRRAGKAAASKEAA